MVTAASAGCASVSWSSQASYSVVDNRGLACAVRLLSGLAKHAPKIVDRRNVMTTIFITGAAGALGSAVAKAFDAAGANTILIGRDVARLEAACGPASERRMFAIADLRDAASVAAAARAGGDRFGRIDALCNIAGGFAMGTPVHATSDAQWDELFDLNVCAACAMPWPPWCQACSTGRVARW